jgi:hypothetical protein
VDILSVPRYLSTPSLAAISLTSDILFSIAASLVMVLAWGLRA